MGQYDVADLLVTGRVGVNAVGQIHRFVAGDAAICGTDSFCVRDDAPILRPFRSRQTVSETTVDLFAFDFLIWSPGKGCCLDSKG